MRLTVVLAEKLAAIAEGKGQGSVEEVLQTSLHPSIGNGLKHVVSKELIGSAFHFDKVGPVLSLFGDECPPRFAR